MEPNPVPGAAPTDLPGLPRLPPAHSHTLLPEAGGGFEPPYLASAPPGGSSRAWRRGGAPALVAATALGHALPWAPLPATHAGLAGVDPWAPQGRAARGFAIWPWGLRGLAETLEVLALALLMFIAVRAVAQNFVIDGRSMEPTFAHGQLLIVNKLAYRSFDLSWLPGVESDEWRPFGEPAAGDVVVFRFPRDPSRDFIKRIVAVAGQTVAVEDSIVYVDGVQLAEPYIDEPPAYSVPEQVVPEGSVFVLGDNRNNSFDSHSWGMLEESLIIGRAELRYWPLSSVGRVDHVRQAGTPLVEVSISPSIAR